MKLTALAVTDKGLVRDRNEDVVVLVDLSVDEAAPLVGAEPAEPSSDEASSDEASGDEASSDEASSDEASSDEASSDEASSDEASSDEASSDEASSANAGGDAASSDDASSAEPSSDELASHHQVHCFEVGKRGALLAVFDGMGGAASGDVASGLGRDVVLREVRAAGAETHQELAETLGQACVKAHREIRRRAAADPSCTGMGTTMTAAAVMDDRLILVQVGDSRAYLFRAGELVQVTEDQSLLHELVATGRIAAEDAASYEHSNVILQALGVNDRVYPAVTELELRRHDLLFLCSDGLTDLVQAPELEALIEREGSHPERLAAALVEAAKHNGGFDNVSVVVAHVGGDVQPAEENASVPVPRRMTLQRTPTGPPPASRHREWFLLLAALLLMLAMAGVIILLGRGSG